MRSSVSHKEKSIPQGAKTFKVPFLDLTLQYRAIKSELDQAVQNVIQEQKFILGPEVDACEAAVRDYVSARFACGVSSGTDALLVSLMAEGIGPGDEVITSAYSFFATAGSVARLGATPVLVDIDPVTFNLNPAQIKARITKKTKALIPVHLFGQAAEMDPVLKIAKEHGLAVLEDAAQAIGSEYKGRRVGSLGDYGCFSFFPAKNLGAFGDGGMVVTNDPNRYELLRALRAHGASPTYYHSKIGGNFRLDSLQAAVILVKLKYLDEWTARRNENAALYSRSFAEAGLTEKFVVTPRVTQTRHNFNSYVIRAKERDALAAHLAQHGIGHAIYYPLPLHLQECFAYLGCQKGNFPESEKASREALALPVFPELAREQIEFVIQTIAQFYRS